MMITIMRNNTKVKKISIALLIVLCTVVVAMVGGMRDRLHIDEVWSYGLSNNNGAPFYYDYGYGIGNSILQDRADFDYHNEQDYKDYFYNWHTSDYYREYLTVQENERFDYANVFSNQTADTHPPLYYCLIHTVCSLFPNTFSMWFGLVINLIFYAGSLLFLYLIAKDLFQTDILAILSMLLWGLSRAGITEGIFIRMYMMATFLVLCLIYVATKLIHKFHWSLVAIISIIEILGFLTHYYFYIVAFFLTLFVCLYFLLKGQIRNLFGYGFAALASVGISIAIFPATIRHLTQGAWSGTTANNFGYLFNFPANMCRLLNQVLSYYTGAEINMYVVLYIIYLLAVITLLIFIVMYKCNNRHEEKYEMTVDEYFIKNKNVILSYIRSNQTDIPIAVIFTATAFVSGITIAGLEPDMGEYTIRYLFIVLPLFSIFIVYILRKATCKVLNSKSVKSQYSSLALCIGILIICSNLFQQQVLLKSNQQGVALPLEGRKVITANVESYRDHAFAYLYLDAEEVYPIDKIDSRFCDALSQLNEGESVICLLHSELASIDEIEDFLSKIDGISYRYLTSSTYPLEINNLYHVFEVVINAN